MLNQYFPPNFGEDVKMWIGVVEDRSDPLQMGRVRVRIYNHHTSDTSLIPTETLPWAQIMMPATSASMSGVGRTPTGLMIGTLVLGIWLDGTDKQTPMVLGSFHTLEGDGSSTNIIDRDTNVINDGNNNNMGVPGDFNPTGDGPQWLQVARGELGTKEIKGPQHNPRILEYLKSVGISSGDETPWCAAFARWALDKAGVSTTGINGLARSFTRSPAFTKIDKLEYGCIVVFGRSSSPTYGHVGFYVGSQGGRIQVLGGNQSDSVSIGGFSSSRLVGAYWPTGAPRSGGGTSVSDIGTPTSGKDTSDS